MRPKNEYARLALISLKVFLSARCDGVGVPRTVRAAAKNARAVLKPFLETAEDEIVAMFGAGPFPPQFFADMLKGFINAERDRRIAAGLDPGPVNGAAKALVPFLLLAKGLLPMLAARNDDATDAN